MTREPNQPASSSDADGTPMNRYEPPTLTPLGTADEAVADEILFS